MLNQLNKVLLLLFLAFFAVGFAQGPPKEPGPFRQTDLVELVKLDPAIKLDIRYATKNNFLGRPVYKEPRAFLQRPAAEALSRVNQSLRKQGFGLVVFDGYRPWSVTKIFWDATPEETEGFAVYEPEWWHYDYKDWKEYPILDVPFAAIGRP